MAKPKNPYGLKPGNPTPVFVEDVERGIACNCFCPACGDALEARKGDVVSPYFAHARGAEECGAGYQTALHIMAKEVLAEQKRILLPSLLVYPDPSVWRTRSVPSFPLVPSWKRLTLDSVILERKLGSIIPDVTIRKADRTLLVEIKVTHGINPEKLRKIEALGIAVVEFDFSGESRIVTKEELKRVLVDTYGTAGCGYSRWIYHPKMAGTIERLNREHIEAHPLPSDNRPTKKQRRSQQTSFLD